MHICLLLYGTVLSLLHTLLQHINIFFLYAFPGYSVWHRRPHNMEKANVTTGKGHSFGSFHKEGITLLFVVLLLKFNRKRTVGFNYHLISSFNHVHEGPNSVEVTRTPFSDQHYFSTREEVTSTITYWGPFGTSVAMEICSLWHMIGQRHPCCGWRCRKRHQVSVKSVLFFKPWTFNYLCHRNEKLHSFRKHGKIRTWIDGLFWLLQKPICISNTD